MGEEFVGMSIAIAVVSATIILSGISIGVGKAFGYKKVQAFGIEELLQSIVNAAIVGAFAAIVQFISQLGATSARICGEGNIVEQLLCSMDTTGSVSFVMFQELTKLLQTISYYQTLQLDFGAFSIAPFENLSSLSPILSNQLFLLNVILIFVNLNAQIALFIKANALSLILPFGLVLRSFFATRRLGGYLIALAIGIFVIFPSFVLIFPLPQNDIQNATLQIQNVNNNTFYTPIPVVDLNNNYAIAGKIDLMSGRCFQKNLANNSACIGLLNVSISSNLNTTNVSNTTTTGAINTTTSPKIDFVGDLTITVQRISAVISKALLFSAIGPLVSLLITLFFVKEFGGVLGGELGLQSFRAA